MQKIGTQNIDGQKIKDTGITQTTESNQTTQRGYREQTIRLSEQYWP